MIQINSLAKISEVSPNVFTALGGDFETVFADIIGQAGVFMEANPNKGFVSHSLTFSHDIDENGNKIWGGILSLFTTINDI